LERLCSALLLGAAFFFAALGLSAWAKRDAKQTIAIAICSLFSVMATSAVLVLWRTDEQLTQDARDFACARASLQDLVATQQDKEDQAKLVEPSSKRCSYCKREINYRARKCPECHEFLDDSLRETRTPSRSSPGAAAVMSFLLPGLGQVYTGRILAGLFWLCLTPLGYLCCFPGVILHVLCIFDAVSGAE
jgi:hypothetical protein